MTVFTEMDKLIQLDTYIKQRFSDAQKRLTNEAELLQKELEALQTESREYYTMMILGDITNATYQEQQATVKEKQSALASVQKALADIDDLQREELKQEVFLPMKELEKEINQAVSKNNEEVKKKVLQAKAKYIRAIIESKSGLEKHHSYIAFMERVELGQGRIRTNRLYKQYIDVVDRLISNYHSGTTGAELTVEEIVQIVSSEQLPKKLKEAIEK